MSEGKTATDIYFILEHKSYPDKLVLLQILNYCSVFWEEKSLTLKHIFSEPDKLKPALSYAGRPDRDRLRTAVFLRTTMLQKTASAPWHLDNHTILASDILKEVVA